jgi:hypothetical protein
MRYSIPGVALIFLAPISSHFTPIGVQAFDKTGCEMDCQKCHTLTNEEMKEILRDLNVTTKTLIPTSKSPKPWGLPGLPLWYYPMERYILGCCLPNS